MRDYLNELCRASKDDNLQVVEDLLEISGIRANATARKNKALRCVNKNGHLGG